MFDKESITIPPYNTVILHRGIGAQYDARIRKMMKTLAYGNRNPLALFWERGSQAYAGEYSEGQPFSVMRLPFESKKHPRPGIAFSIIEVLEETFFGYRALLKHRAKTTIICNHRLFLLILVLQIFRPPEIKKLVWDLQELPTGFLKKGSIRARFFAHLMKGCDATIIVNPLRLRHLEETYGAEAVRNSHILPNYVDTSYVDRKSEELPVHIRTWLGGRDYYYLQNPFTPARYPKNAIEGILAGSNKAIIVTGRVPPTLIVDLCKSQTHAVNSRVYFTGMLPEIGLNPIIDNAFGSIILYDNSTVNNEYCDPNRLFLVMARGIPVIVGVNSGLRTYTERYGCGIGLSTDGRSIEDIVFHVKEFEAGYERFWQKAQQCRMNLTWECNESELLAACGISI